MLISEEYRKQQTELHKNPGYGVASVGYAAQLASLLTKMEVSGVLDYGAGKQRLRTALAVHGWEKAYWPYEPSDPENDKTPDHPVECVVCIDVLEHIEPECLDAVLDDLKRLTGRMGFFTIATGPALKVLPDGRNAHLIQEDERFWLPKIIDRFRLLSFQVAPGNNLLVVVRPRS